MAFPGFDSPACFYRNSRKNLECGGNKHGKNTL
nr:MAG TPA: hypothetical protein [Bacteriophage sp.]